MPRTIAAMVAGPLWVYPLWASPPADLIADATSVRSFFPIHRCGMAEPLAEYYGFQLSAPPKPTSVENEWSVYHDWLAAQTSDYYVPRADEESRFPLTLTAALAETARLCNAIGPELDQQGKSELSAVLGHPVANVTAGLAELQ